MNDALLMGRFKRLRDLSRNGQRLVERHGSLSNPIRERRPLHQFHDQGGNATRILKPVDRGDVRVIQ